MFNESLSFFAVIAKICFCEGCRLFVSQIFHKELLDLCCALWWWHGHFGSL